MIKGLIRNIVLNILIFIYQLNFFNTFVLKIISYIGGPIFIKFLQTFNNLNSLKYYSNEGTIGTITYDNEYATKKLRPNIINNF